MTQNKKTTCGWPGDDPLMIRYHDTEWGTPVHDDRKLFEFLILDGAQAGLSWQTVLNKRENYRRAFDGFDFHKIARYTGKDMGRLLADAGIIRNRLKLASAIKNANQILNIQKEFKSFDNYIWQFVGGKPIDNRIKCLEEIPATSREAESMSRDLVRRGFSFVGPTICYAFMQSAGLVNDHLMDCFRHDDLAQAGKSEN